jgi:NADPH:quinone reductase
MSIFVVASCNTQGRLNRLSYMISMNRMPAIRATAVGGPEVLAFSEIDTPEPREGEVLVALEAIGVNYTDIYQRQGRPGQVVPFTPGYEAAGTIVACGPDVRDWAIGARVAYCMVPGAYAQSSVVPTGRLIAVPDDISFELAAALPLQGLTAHFLINDYVTLGPESVVLVHAAAGGVGLLACQLAARTGAHVIGTVSSPAKAAIARAHGARDVIVYTDADFVAETHRLTAGLGAHLVLDGVGKATLGGSLSVARNCGTVVLYGWPSGIPEPVAPQDLMWRALRLCGGTVTNHIATRAALDRRANDLFARVRDGRLTVKIERTFPLEQAADAHRLLESRQSVGKILLRP